MTNPIPVTSIDGNLLGYYSKLREHRCRITEGIRVIAFRNVDHLNAAMRLLGVSGFPDLATISRVQDKMLKDQGLERNDRNRWFLGYATWIPWEIYMCLLCAEIDNYEEISQKHTPLAYMPLDVYLASHQAVVQSLRDARDLLLHPIKDASMEDILRQFAVNARRMSPDHLIALVEAQTQIDDYLEWLRTSLLESVSNEIYALSAEQIFEDIHREVRILTRLVTESKNDEEREGIEQSLGELVAVRDRFTRNFNADYTLTSEQRRELVRWQERRAVLALSLPKRPYASSPVSIQTPIRAEFLSLLPAQAMEGQQPWTGQALPEFLRRRRSECIGLLIRSLILQNEPYTNTISVLDSKFPGKSRAEVLDSEDLRRVLLRQLVPLETPEDYLRTELLIASSMVSLALLAEPLRLYKQATSDRPDLRREEIERRIQGDALDTFARLRNVVFHVPDERTDLSKAETDFFDKASSLGDDYPEVIASLLSFYLPEPTGESGLPN